MGLRLLEQILEAIGTSEEDLLARVKQNPRVFWLLSDAVDAARLARESAKVDALARLAQSGLRDDARLDEAAYMISIVAQLEVIHFRALEAIDALQEPHARRDGVGVDVAAALNTSKPVAEALCSHLLRLALVEAPGMSFRGLHHEVLISSLGREVLRLLRTDAIEKTDGVSQSTEAGPPPYWRAIRTQQIEVGRWVSEGDEASARAALTAAGFAVNAVAPRGEDERVSVDVSVPTDEDGAQFVYDAVAAVLAAAGIPSQQSGFNSETARVGYAYHHWRQLLIDGEAATFEGRPLKMLTGPDIDTALVLESYARWFGTAGESLTLLEPNMS